MFGIVLVCIGVWEVVGYLLNRWFVFFEGCFLCFLWRKRWIFVVESCCLLVFLVYFGGLELLIFDVKVYLFRINMICFVLDFRCNWGIV